VVLNPSFLDYLRLVIKALDECPTGIAFGISGVVAFC